jgi:1,4-dihydroxy-2-naphthoate octaprenyltransferase
VFFGLVAVVGTDYVLSGSAGSAVTWLAAVALGGLAAAALVVNNARDIEHDRSVGRRTLPALLGRRRTELVYGLALVGPFVLLPLMAVPGGALSMLLPLLLLPSALRLRRDFVHCPPGLPFNGVLFRTFLMELKFAALLAAGAVLARLLG